MAPWFRKRAPAGQILPAQFAAGLCLSFLRPHRHLIPEQFQGVPAIAVDDRVGVAPLGRTRDDHSICWFAVALFARQLDSDWVNHFKRCFSLPSGIELPPRSRYLGFAPARGLFNCHSSARCRATEAAITAVMMQMLLSSMVMPIFLSQAGRECKKYFHKYVDRYVCSL